ncbi:MAG: hypothetical protein RSE96_11140, partial [Niameybacter sp.]
MKRWSNPRITQLALSKTYENTKNEHYCHAINKVHPNGSCDDNRDNGCKGTDVCNWKGQSHLSKCCCSPSSSD